MTKSVIILLNNVSKLIKLNRYENDINISIIWWLFGYTQIKTEITKEIFFSQRIQYDAIPRCYI